MEGVKVVCWDLDENLGNFESAMLTEEELASVSSSSINPLALRFRIVDVLQEMMARGIVHCITTASPIEYAKEAVSRTGIAEYFHGRLFAGREVMECGLGKKYMPVAQEFGYTAEQARQNMVVVGDKPFDKPVDIEGLVFIQQTNAASYDAVVPYRIVNKLLKEGKGDIKAGFDFLYGNAVQTENGSNRFELSECIKFDVDYVSIRGSDALSHMAPAGKPVVPRILCLPCHSYKEEPVPVPKKKFKIK